MNEANRQLKRARLQLKGRDKRIEYLEIVNRKLLAFAIDVARWKTGADELDEENGDPPRDYCEDIDLIENYAKMVVESVEGMMP